MDLINILFAKALNNGDATKEYVDKAIKALKGEVNADLDTLEELSRALGNDPNFFLNVKNQLDKKITQEEFNSAIANLVSISNYNPIDKTDSMTQPVGKSADGKLWTSPGSGTGSAEAVLYTLQSLTDVQQAQARENIGAADAVTVNELKDDMAGKLTEPAEGLAVGKYFRVAAIDENGHAVLEAVDAKDVGVQDVQINDTSIVKNGIVNTYISTTSGLKYDEENGLRIYQAPISFIAGRTNKQCPITSNNLDYAVKASMCDGKGAAWTDAERIAALLRMGCTVDENGFVKWGASE